MGGISSPPKTFITNHVVLCARHPATATGEKYRKRIVFQRENFFHVIHHLVCKSLCHSSGHGRREQPCHAKAREQGRWMKLFYVDAHASSSAAAKPEAAGQSDRLTKEKN